MISSTRQPQHFTAPLNCSTNSTMRFLVALLALASTVLSVAVPFKNCGSDADLATVASIDAPSWPPVKGVALPITVTLNAKESIQGGSVHSVVKFYSAVAKDSTEDICTTFIGGKFPCNQPAGTLSFTNDLVLPANTYAGTCRCFSTSTLDSFSLVQIPTVKLPSMLLAIRCGALSLR